MQKLRPNQALRGLWGAGPGVGGALALGDRRWGGAGRLSGWPAGARGNPRCHLGAARKLNHVWASTSEGAGPRLSLGDAQSFPFAREKGGYRTAGGVEQLWED